MNFEYDRQTFYDLEILKDHQEISVFSIFDKTLTEGGSDYLKELIKSPLNDLNELEERVVMIRYFTRNPLQVTVSRKKLQFVERYINLGVPVLKSNVIDSWYHRVLEWLRPTNDYYLLSSGCESLLAILTALGDQLVFDALPDALQLRVKTLQTIIGALQSEFNVANFPSWSDVIRLDKFFRIRFRKYLSSMLQEIYFLDAMSAIALVGLDHSFTLPVYVHSEKPQLTAKGLRHPLLQNAVANDIEMGPDKNMCFLTGPNMAGKSTFLKSIGIAIYLAHLGFPVPASEFKTSLYSGMITSINLSDDLSFGYSHFYSEVNRVKHAAQALAQGKRMLVIFDELFRGTNVKDALEASTEIIKGFARIDACKFFMSTHIVEIAEAIKDKPNICFRFFDSELYDTELVYSYQLKSGISSERLGMYIVRREGIFELLNSIENKPE